ncbi:acetyl-CoA carboxylase biotin carboxyl carrier protein subunit [Amycolatopsis acidicola]|uniref:Biotin carboxyl carrier protein of acetyl-CoA carboxylase n=1 Tax=Amycolatopsis acidicola TaxID=2596893 RepID=A0A5N0VP03_9PSEU|nr:biotin/lipoyl-containing protein [Amycolatopsis acidicola]KAA9166522.1 acetyl-CoA carboxylase biotin carboxyl carrier protein subunit [Amycolatopsis acidicola]
MPGEPADATCELLREATRAVTELLAHNGSRPGSLHVRAGGVAIELDFGGGPAAVPREEPEAAGEDLVVAPTVGVFYRAPSPGAEPFVREGDRVTAGQQVAIVEAMKLAIPVAAGRDGTILRVLKDNGADVEYGEPLLELAAS